MPVADPLDLCVDPAPAVPPGAEFEEQNVLDRLASILADTPDTPCAIAAYPSPISIASATPAPSELSFESRDSSASVEPESGGAATSQHAGGGQKAKSSQRKYWTPEQDAALIAAKEDPGKRDWTWKEIAELLNCGHRSVQCRARYLLLKDKQKSEFGILSRGLREDVRARQLTLKWSDLIVENPEDDPARPPKLSKRSRRPVLPLNICADPSIERIPENQGRSFFTANDDAIILAHLLGEVWIDWSVVGASLNPPRTGDSCYQRSRKLRKKTVAERRAILQAYEPPSPASRAGTPAACPSPAFFAAVAPSTSANAKPDAPTERAERGAVTTPPAATADAPEASPSPSLAATSDIQIDPSLYAS